MLMSFRKNERFYHLHEQRNLFGGISLILSWGTFDNNRGGHKFIFCNNYEELHSQIAKISKVRIARGYLQY